jgi:alkylation response protein AidB-like acyl-CoA dehydrogenase
VKLITLYGSGLQQRRLADAVGKGGGMGVWNAEDTDRVLIGESSRRAVLHGRKIYASGAGHLLRPLITADVGERIQVMVVLDGPMAERTDTSKWKPSGMRATATGTVDLTALEVRPDQIIGEPGDYFREPAFSCGAWRFVAVPLGGLEALVDAAKHQLQERGRVDDPAQRARFGEIAISIESARLWVREAADFAETADIDPARAHKVVDLAGMAIDRIAFQIIEQVVRSLGLASQMRPSPVERLLRDVTTYLRQPAPDRILDLCGRRLLTHAAYSWDTLSTTSAACR